MPSPSTRADSDDDELPAERPLGREPQPLPGRATNVYANLGPEALDEELARRHQAARSLPERIELVTRGLLKAPYLLSPLGEGALPDRDPRFRVDAFDCTTFVETGIALALARDLEDARRLLDDVRYAEDTPSFEARRHLVTSQWVPGLVGAGFLEDVTEQIGGRHARAFELELTPERWWKRRVARTLELPLERIPRGRFRVPFLPLDEAIRLADSIPPGTVIDIIRQNVPSSPDVVTHQGLVVTHPGDKTRFVRHASPVAQRVIDEPLVLMMKRYKKPRRWPIVGASFLRILDRRSPSTR